MKLKGAIFDMDGLLFDTERVYQETWKEIAKERHIVLDRKFPRAISGTNGIYMCRVIEKYYQVSDGAPIMEECMERMRQKLAVHVPMQEGVCEILQFFREEGIPMAVASSSSVQQIEANLRTAGIRDYFEEIVSGTEVENGKPAPDIFLLAAERLGLKPEECFVFEDSENGIRAGHAAGCFSVMVPDLIEASPEVRQLCSMLCESLLQARDEIRVKI